MRKYTRGANGEERPVWASKRKLIALGTQEGRDAFKQNRQPIRLSNTVHDNAAKAEFDRLTRELEQKNGNSEKSD